ncbi:MAG TPA: A24 family peptidase [Rhizomicrobium sp.]|jgi:leader peptidase (prepilin peptidase)/N-methyltransferase|nr:A24 family peptidase [Rhizomicrobium sp.]
MPDATDILIALAVIAPFIGSFLGVLVVRLPERRPVLIGRSRCDRCGAALGARDLVPLASWLWLRGKCRQCGAAIGAFPVLMELAALAVVLWAATETSGGMLVAACVFGWLLLALAVIDWQRFLLPDALTAPLALFGLAAAWFLDRGAFLNHVIGCAAGFLVFAGITVLYRRLRGREGLGLGDAKLLGALGAWVSWQGLPSVIFIGAVTGLLFVLVQSLAGRRIEATTRIPFGTFLALCGWLVWLYAPLIASISTPG